MCRIQSSSAHVFIFQKKNHMKPNHLQMLLTKLLFKYSWATFALQVNKPVCQTE